MFLFVYSPWKAATNIEGACDWYLWLTEGFMSKANDHSFSFFPFPLPIKKCAYLLLLFGSSRRLVFFFGVWQFLTTFPHKGDYPTLRESGQELPRRRKPLIPSAGNVLLWWKIERKVNTYWIQTEWKMNFSTFFLFNFFIHNSSSN